MLRETRSKRRQEEENTEKYTRRFHASPVCQPQGTCSVELQIFSSSDNRSWASTKLLLSTNLEAVWFTDLNVTLYTWIILPLLHCCGHFFHQKKTSSQYKFLLTVWINTKQKQTKNKPLAYSKLPLFKSLKLSLDSKECHILYFTFPKRYQMS